MSTHNLRPVQKINLSDADRRKRILLIVLLLAIGLSALGYGIYSLLRTEPGWQTVEPACDGVNIGNEFTLQYLYSGSAAERRQINTLYSQAVEKAYWLFTNDQSPADVHNLYAINRRPNEVCTVDPVLYKALTQLELNGGRYLYLGPVYAEYNSLFSSESDAQAQVFDPRQNADAAAYIRQLISFTGNPKAICLELLGENRVRLKVSEAYLAFAEEYEIEDFLDLQYMKNAFAADYIADTLIQNGFTHGFLSSYDGFARTLDGGEFSMNLFSFLEETIYPAGIFSYHGPMSLVNLRSFPTSQLDRYHYYVPEKGAIVTSFIDPRDGLCKSSTPSLLSYSRTESCTQILLRILPCYLAEEAALQKLKTMDSIDSIWCEGTTIYHTETSAAISNLFENEDLRYTASPLT